VGARAAEPSITSTSATRVLGFARMMPRMDCVM
jgi:hypothetical protein